MNERFDLEVSSFSILPPRREMRILETKGVRRRVSMQTIVARNEETAAGMRARKKINLFSESNDSLFAENTPIENVEKISTFSPVYLFLMSQIICEMFSLFRVLRNLSEQISLSTNVFARRIEGSEVETKN